MILKFFEFISEKREVPRSKEKLSEKLYPLSSLIGSMTNGTLDQVPIDALKEIISWKEIKKSPFSISFYDNFWTNNDGTARIADHWNYKSTYYKERKGKTLNVHITKKWAKGIYHANKDGYEIVKIYEIPENNAELVRKLGRELKEPITMSASKIELFERVKKGDVIFIQGKIRGKVKNMNTKIAIVQVGKFEESIRLDKPFQLEIDGKIIDSEDLRKDGIIK